MDETEQEVIPRKKVLFENKDLTGQRQSIIVVSIIVITSQRMKVFPSRKESPWINYIY